MKTGSNVSNVVPARGAQKETTLSLTGEKMIIRLIIDCKVISLRNVSPLEKYQPRGARQHRYNRPVPHTSTHSKIFIPNQSISK